MKHISLTTLAQILSNSEELQGIHADDIMRVLELFFEMIEGVEGPIYFGHEGLIRPDDSEEEVQMQTGRDPKEPVH